MNPTTLGESEKRKQRRRRERRVKSPLIIKHKEFLIFLNQLKPRERKKLINTLKREHVHCLSEIFSNFLKKKLTVDPQVLRKLKKYKTDIKTVSLKKTPLHLKKKILSSVRGGGILSVLIPLAASVLGGLLKP